MSNPAMVHDEGTDVVVSGMSGRLPESGSIEEFARQLFDGVDLVTTDDRRWTPGMYGLPERMGKIKDLEHFDAMFFGVHAKQADHMDPQIRLLLEVTYEAIVDAGLSPVEMRGSNTGVYVATGGSEGERLWNQDIHKIDGYALIGCCRSMFANRLSYAYDLKGPSIALDTACSSCMTAFTQAVNAIHAGHCDTAIVAGSNLCLDPACSINFQRINVLSQEGRCAVFDAGASGYVRSEAVVVVLLQRRRDARRVYCTVRSARMNNDGYKLSGITYPDGKMQYRLAQETYDKAHVRPQDVVYLEAHGTGTTVGDPEEANAVAELFCKDRQTPLLLGALKSNMGHAEIASGLCSMVKIILAMERGVIPGNLHFKEPNPSIPAISDGHIKVVAENTPWQGGLVGLNSFGFGGSNAHVILEGGRGPRGLAASYTAPRLVLASGRTDEAVERLLRLAAEHPRDAELHALIDAVHARAVPGHPRRGYAVLGPASPVLEVRESEGQPRPVWFVFSGMGSQWSGMAQALLRLPTFAASIARSAAALRPLGVDLQHVIEEAPDAAFDDIVNSFVSIAAVQVALVDVLRELNVQPDGFIGHSAGEIGCAYADGTLTAEQTVLCAYWRGRCTLEARPAPGAMAAVGLSWEEAARRCPKDVHIACHNSLDNVTLSGKPTSVSEFMEQLSAEGVFVKKINTGGIAFHSPYVAGVAPLLHMRLQEVIPKPKARSKRWISSSVPQNEWDSNLVQLSDAAYHVNNLLSPVRFAEALAQVPSHALVLEVAPHALLQAVLKRTLPNAAHVPLVHRDAPDALVHLLTGVGRAYTHGTQPQVSRVYPAVSWPVSRGTPGLASHVGWDHSAEWSVPDFKTAGQNIIEYDLRNSDEAFIAGHNIDGRILFPATGYLMLVWRTVAKMNWLDTEHAAVVLEDVQFHRATIVPWKTSLRFHVSILETTGEFEVCEGGVTVVTGTVHLTATPDAERLPTKELPEETRENQEQDLRPLDSEDIYKELWLRGYNYKGVFRGIISSDAHGTCGLLKWEGNWMSFMDTVLQFGIIATNVRALFVPKSIRHIIIDPVAQREAVIDGAVSVKRYRNIDVISSGGVEFRGLSVASVARRINTHASPKLERYEFVPYENHSFGPEDNEILKYHAFTATLQLVCENCGTLQLSLGELALQQPVEKLLLPYVMKVLGGEAQVRVTATLAAGEEAARYATDMDPLGIRVLTEPLTEDGIKSNYHLVLGVDILARPEGFLDLLASASANFVLLEEPASALDEPTSSSLLAKARLTLVSSAYIGPRVILLLRRAAVVPATRVAVEARDDNYGWVERLKDAMKRAESEDMRVYVWSRAPCSGVQGLATCLRCEPGGNRLRLYYLPGARDAFDPYAPAFRDQVQRDLAFNVLREGAWGTFRHMPLEDVSGAEIQVKHAHVDMLTRGDLSSLRWMNNESLPLMRQQEENLCHIYYSSLNFHDILIATNKLPPDSFMRIPNQQESNLGTEFSGRSSSGMRVMGIVAVRGLATTVLAKEPLMWEVPKQWSLEEAATVPVAYTTAYYALCVRGRMRRGETVLVHAGAGGVGQAAIAVALHGGCTVFTTVGTPEKRAFLRTRFPQLLDANIGNSRDCSFEQLVMRRTDGRGIDLVLNSLAGDKMQASLRCLATGGRFLEIGKLDSSAYSALSMAVLLKNMTLHGIHLDLLCKEPGNPELAEIESCVTEGIKNGTVRPLPATIFADDQLEEAFRYMARGKHIGKVLIRIREEEEDDEPMPERLMRAIPRIYMHPGKSYVLVGGLGGFGLELADWLVGRGARTVVLNSRNGVRTGYQAWCIRRWRLLGVVVVVSDADAASREGARALLQDAAAVAPVGGIFNLAVELRDALLENQTPDSFCTVSKPKIDVTREMDAASRDLAPELEYFVAFSSLACGRGNAGQSNYGLANSSMERLCEQRQADGLPALAVQWGAVGDVGIAAAMLAGEDLEVVGTMPQSISSCLQTLEVLLTVPHAVVASAVLADKRRAHIKHTHQDVVQAVVNILGFKDLNEIPYTMTLTELGMDSLMSAEIKQTLERSYDLLLSVQEIRALTYEKLQAIADGAQSQLAPTSASRAGASDSNFKPFKDIMPEQVLIKLPSLSSEYSEDKLIFMIHPIEGVVDMLRGIAALVRGAVYGLQCARAVPLDDMASLARFYVARVRAVQPRPPYMLLGYSFGAAAAFEMALQLEQDGCAVRLVLVDGSPAHLSANTSHFKERYTTLQVQEPEVYLLSYLSRVFFNLDSVKVGNELEELPDWEARFNRAIELITASGASVDKDSLRDAAQALKNRFIISDSYKPEAVLRAPVTLFTALDNYVSLGADYGLRAVCTGELRTYQLAATHKTIVAGDAARTIADYVSKVLAYN